MREEIQKYFHDIDGVKGEGACLVLVEQEPYTPTSGLAYFAVSWNNTGECKRDNPPEFDPAFVAVRVEGSGLVSLVWSGRNGGEETIASHAVDPNLEPIAELRRRGAQAALETEKPVDDIERLSGASPGPATVSIPTTRDREPFEDYIEFRNPQAEAVVRGFMLPCSNGRQVTLMEAIERPVRQMYSATGRYLYTTIDSRGDEVRVYHQIRGHDGFRGPNHVIITVNDWGDINLNGVTMDALLLPCYL